MLVECLNKSAIIVICFEMRYEVGFPVVLFFKKGEINKCPVSDSKLGVNPMFQSLPLCF